MKIKSNKECKSNKVGLSKFNEVGQSKLIEQ